VHFPNINAFVSLITFQQTEKEFSPSTSCITFPVTAPSRWTFRRSTAKSKVRWLNAANTAWSGESPGLAGSALRLQAPSPDTWVALIEPFE